MYDYLWENCYNMKGSKLLADVNLDIRIERGLKILEFGTQYNLRKAYYRHCPINISPGDRENAAKAKALQRQEHNDFAEILNQLNQEIANSQEEAPRQSSKKGEGPAKVGKIMPPLENYKRQSHSSHASSSSQSKVMQDGEEEDPWEESLDALSNYHSQAPKEELKPILEDPDEGNSVSNLPIVNKSHIKSNGATSDIVRVEDLHDVSATSKKSTRQKVEQAIRKPDNNNSKFIKSDKVGQISVSNIHEVSQKSTKPNEKSIQTSREQRELTPRKKKGEQLSHISSKSAKSSTNSNKSFLDKSISRIVSHSSQIRSGQQKDPSNLSDFSLMRQLSASFQDDENMRMLLKLENCELQQGYLERRIVNRLEKGYKEVGQIMDISWESLRLPKMDHTFARPNYAHLID